MNATRRKTIHSLLAKIENLKLEPETVQAEEQEIFDKLSETAQESERGQAIGEAADHLQDALDSLEDVTSSLEQSVEE
ncbi:MAG: hypothetical protein PHN44_01265 [Candidatus Marinimicrobia bacterium]|nr:hypothetical protein [Candidatus Neomarinimicrobiota bacterium]MDD5539076.1 hypothetical protein [Candidatus Neomarinimicrobiota bacterium]